MKLLARLVLSLLSTASLARYTPPTEAELKAAVETFKFRGEWISPVIIKAFLPNTADKPMPTVRAIDVAAATGSQRFAGKIVPEEGTRFVTSLLPQDEKISYRWFGRTEKGRHVVQAIETGSGTFIPVTLLVFSLTPRAAKNHEGTTYQQLWLELERDFPLGDRAQAKITIDGETIITNLEYRQPNRQNEMKVFKLD